jgi:DNA gyrase/topoisomerase IV subunit A
MSSNTNPENKGEELLRLYSSYDEEQLRRLYGDYGIYLTLWKLYDTVLNFVKLENFEKKEQIEHRIKTLNSLIDVIDRYIEIIDGNQSSINNATPSEKIANLIRTNIKILEEPKPLQYQGLTNDKYRGLFRDYIGLLDNYRMFLNAKFQYNTATGKQDRTDEITHLRNLKIKVVAILNKENGVFKTLQTKLTNLSTVLGDAARRIITKIDDNVAKAEEESAVRKGGGKRTAPAAPAYKLNGEKVHLLINKKKLHRSVYVKGNGKAKYCKINYEFVLLSKLKNKII